LGPHNAATGSPYHGLNALYLSTLPYTDQRYLTFRQAQELGGHVRRGEHGHPVVFWKRPDRLGQTDQESDEPEEPSGPRTRSHAVLRAFIVFNLDQCEGLPTERLKGGAPAAEPGETPAPLPTAQTLWDSYPDRPRLRHGGPSAYYLPPTDTIQLPPPPAFTSPAHYYGVLFHEAVHSTGHERRLKRFSANEPQAIDERAEYGREELVAELGAAFLCGLAGIEQPLITNQAAYLRSWYRSLQRDPRAWLWATPRAEAAVDHILAT
jgi:antirestriction protein ArdC